MHKGNEQKTKNKKTQTKTINLNINQKQNIMNSTVLSSLVRGVGFSIPTNWMPLPMVWGVKVSTITPSKKMWSIFVSGLTR